MLCAPLGKKVMLIGNKDIWSFVDQSTFMMLLSLWKTLGVRMVLCGQWLYCLSLIYLLKKKKKIRPSVSFMRFQIWWEMLHSTIKQQFLGLCCSSPPTNMRSFTVQKGVFDTEIKTCQNPPKCRRSLQSLWIPHWKGLWAFLPIFSLSLYAYLHSEFSSESVQAAFFLLSLHSA